jgi:prepilin-type N-terminal cleavage/methylation domain-containing protein
MKATKRFNNGFTLIEVLISMLISTVMVSIAIGQLVSSRTLYGLQEADTRIEENARYALELLSSNIRMAGYKNTHLTATGGAENITQQFFTGDCPGAFTSCTSDGAGNTTDHLAIVLDPETNVTCTGVAVGVNDIIANLFFIAQDNGINSLRCRSYTITNNSTATGIAGSEATLIEGIENMQILYGIADPTDSEKKVDSYVSATNVTDWGRITAARITLLVGTGYNDNVDTSNSRSFTLADATTTAFTDSNRRKIFSTTTVIRNGS